MAVDGGKCSLVAGYSGLGLGVIDDSRLGVGKGVFSKLHCEDG